MMGLRAGGVLLPGWGRAAAAAMATGLPRQKIYALLTKSEDDE